MTRSERVVEIRRLIAAGHTHAAVAEIMGLSRSTVRNYIYDPSGLKNRTRKDSYRKPCPDCGRLMDGSNGRGPNSSKHCRSCAPNHHSRIWTREMIIDCIRDFADKYGKPPGARDWNPPDAISDYRDDIAERFHEDGCWPYVDTVQRLFGSWNAAIEAAGFKPLKPGHKYSDRLSA